MKSKISPKDETTPIITYPCLKQHKEDGYVVLMTSSRVGIVVVINPALEKNNSRCNKLGYYSDNWTIESNIWELFDRKVEIEND